VRFPRLHAYLRGLPAGIDSYPDSVVKTSTFRFALEDKPVPLEDGEVPEALERLVRRPPAVNSWVPEVQMVGVFKLIGDHHFEKHGGTPAFLRWVNEQNKALLGGPLYRVLFWMVPIETLFYGIEQRWTAFRRGTGLRLIERRSGQARMELTYEPHLLDQEGLLAIGTAFEAIATLAGAKTSRVEVIRVGASSGEVVLAWTK
jgi:hypothetical protein